MTINRSEGRAKTRNRKPGADTSFGFKVFTIVSMLSCALLSVWFFFPDPRQLKLTIIVCLAIYYFLLGRSVFKKVVIFGDIKSFITIETVFLIFYFLLFFGPYQSYILYGDPLSYSRFFRNTFEQYSQQSIILSTIGAITFCLGIDGAGNRVPRKVFRITNVKYFREPSLPAVSATLTTLLLVSISVYIGLGFSNANEARYTGAAVGGSAANVYNLITLFSIMLLAQAGPAYRRELVTPLLIIGISLSAGWAVRVLLSGDRNSFFLIGTAAVAVVATYFVRIRLLVVLTLIVSALALYSSVEVARERGVISISEIYDNIIEGNARQSSLSGDSSFSTTTITVRAAIAIVPSKYPWGMGRYKLLGVSGIIPFLRGAVLPEGADTSADVLSRFVLGKFANWNVGSSIVADCYMDFGIFGVLTLMFVIGRIARMIQLFATAYPLSVTGSNMYIICLSYFSEYPRYSFEFPVNSLVWALALLMFVGYLFPRRRWRRTVA